MAISQERYVKISSSASGSSISERSLDGLVFTQGKGWIGSDVFSPDSILTVYDVTQAAKYFGSGTTELEAATKYFSYVSKSGYSPRALSFKKISVQDQSSHELVWKSNGTAYNPGTCATADVTFTETNPTTGDTVTVGSTTYTFKTTVTALNQVAIGSTSTDTRNQFVKVVNGTDGYEGQTANASASAVVDESTGKVVLTARTVGTAGNSIAISDTSSQITTSSAFTGGTDAGSIGESAGWYVPGANMVGYVTFSGTGPSNGDTVVIGDVTYTFKTTRTSVNEVRIMTSIEATMQDFVRVVNGSGGYVGQVMNPYASASVYSSTGYQVKLTGLARSATAITLSKSGTNVSVTAFSGGAADTKYTGTTKVQSMSEALSSVNALSNNFGSFMFADITNSTSSSEIAQVAKMNAAYDTRYLFSLSYVVSGTYSDDLAGMTAWRTAIGTDTKGWCGTYCNSVESAIIPMAILAATDYTATNTATNYMFKQIDGETAVVTSDDVADDLDAIYFNYYGQTHANGQDISFYQRGVMGNGAEGGIAVYCNEMWLKSHIATAIINLLVSVERIPANSDGQSMLYTTISGAAISGVKNGIIEVGKSYDGKEARILQLTDNDVGAEDMLINLGYWLRVVIEKDGDEYKGTYRLVYGKGDSVNMIEGSDILL